VPGATTTVSEVPGGVELHVTGGDESLSEIRRRTSALVSGSKQTRGQHRASGAGLGQFGRCPVVMRNTVLETRDVPGGVAIVIKPGTPAELPWLRREVEARSAQLAAPKPFGPGLMDSCPSAVPDSVTRIEDAPYGVDVKVTAPTDEGTLAIRQRAKQLVTSRPRAADERCPLTVPDGRLHVADIPGGTTIAVQAKRPEDVEALRRAVRERDRMFEPPALSP
jgi:hypothetical protein